MEEKYHPKTIVRKITEALSRSEIETPTGIAHKIGYNPKTVAKYVEMLEELKIVECKRVPLGQKEIKVVKLSPLGYVCREGNSKK
jgi:predicted transcriptional regulator